MVAAYFLDSSALLKRYLSEIGTAWVQALTAKASGNILLISRITSVEILNAIARRQREGNLTSEQTQMLRTIFQQHFTDHYEIVELTPTLTTLARELCARQSLRAYDAVQLASALTILPIIAQWDRLEVDTPLRVIRRGRQLRRHHDVHEYRCPECR